MAEQYKVLLIVSLLILSDTDMNSIINYLQGDELLTDNSHIPIFYLFSLSPRIAHPLPLKKEGRVSDSYDERKNDRKGHLVTKLILEKGKKW